MCVICYKPAKVSIPKKTVLAMFRHNSDGAGICWRDGKKIGYQKGLMSFKDLWRELREHQGEECVIHCRIRSAGSKEPVMTHPFKIPYIGLLFHNGTLAGLGNDLKQSDTAELAQVLSGLSIEKIDKLLKVLSGSWNKFCLVTHAETIFYGEWKQDRGMKFSNLWFKPTNPCATTRQLGFKPNGQVKEYSYSYQGNDEWRPARSDWPYDYAG